MEDPQLMSWQKLLSAHRLGCEPPTGHIVLGRSPFQQDFDRIVFSASFRSLHDKAQVFPLSDEDAVRTRLTHSIETASIGRSLGTIAGVDICRSLGADTPFRPSHIGEIVAAASLAHDIGNPPLGHSGEESIRYWFTHSAAARKLRAQMSDAEIADIDRYEGNAQGFRVLTKLEMPDNEGGMQLTCATLGAVAKYPVSSSAAIRPRGVSGRKFNFFQAEKTLFAKVAEITGLLPVNASGDGWCRHPLAYLVEAADDVTYRIVDFEDAHLLRIISYPELERMFLACMGADAEAIRANLASLHDERRKVEFLRARALGSLIGQLAGAFRKHEREMLAGELEHSLIELIPAAPVLEEIYAVSQEKIYTFRRATEIYVAGFELTSGLLDVFTSAVEECVEARRRGEAPEPHSAKLLLLLPPDCSPENDPVWNAGAYERLLRILDCVSGMTDTHAVATFKKIKGISLPGMLF